MVAVRRAIARGVPRAISPVERPARAPSRARRKRQRLVRGALGLLAFFLLWELLYQVGVLNPLYFGEPVAVIRNLFDLLFVNRELLPDLEASALEFIIGFTLGAVSAAVLGVLIGWFSWLDDFVDPLVAGLYATPYVAFLPLIVIVVGIGMWSKAVVILWATFFPVLINAIVGVKNTPPDLLRVARSFSLGRLRVFRTVVLPSSVPYLLAGLRQAVGRGLVAVIVAEFFLANKGVGFFIREAAGTFRPDDAFAGILLVAIVGISLVRIVGRIERDVGRKWGTSQAG